MEYAPVTIVTLNRYKHLKRCIQSLQKNPYAKFTDLYISVDYPPSDKYIDGYKKVLDYVNSGITGFKKTHIYIQEKNLGSARNGLFLKFEVFKKFDKAIFLEDDNEVSPCFLEFCNKGLDFFEEDDSIVGINASSYVWCGKGYVDRDKPFTKNENNIVKRQLVFHAWATWKKTWFELYNQCASFEFYKMGRNFKQMRKLRSVSSCFFYFYIFNVLISTKQLPWINNKEILPTDAVWDIYMMINDKYIIAPKMSLIRDLGVDGSGVNYIEKFENMDELINKKISSDMYFEFNIVTPLETDVEEIELHDKNGYNLFRTRIKGIVFYIFKYFFNFRRT